MDLTHRVAVVTGGTQGIGLATVKHLAECGASVALCARDSARLAGVVADLQQAYPGVRVLGVPTDVSRPSEVTTFAEQVLAHFGHVDILVNNAGTSSRGPFLDVGEEQWEQDIQVKLLATIRCCRAFIPAMRQRGRGAIINFTTVGGRTPGAGSMPTSVSRAAVLALTKALSKEFAADGIRVNAISLGVFRAGQHERAAERRGIDVASLYAERAAAVPLGRVGEPQEAARLIAFLGSDLASYITGACVNIDGGASAIA